MMDDDFGDFTGFSQAHGTSSVTDHKDSSKEASFQSKNGILNSVSSDNNAQGTGGVANFAQFDVNFDIPPPLSPPGTNVHVAGGVLFDIPPLDESFSFDDFTPDVESEHAFQFPGKNAPTTTANETSVGGSVSHQSAVQPVAEFGHFNSSITPTADKTELKTQIDTTSSQATAIDSEWAADFNIPPPIDTAEDPSMEKTASEINTTSGGIANDSGWAADFGSFNIPPPIDSIEDSVQESISSEAHKLSSDPISTRAPDMKEESAFEEVSAQTESKTVPLVTEKAEEGFGDFSAFSTTTAAPSSTPPADFANFTSFDPPPLPDSPTPASTPAAPPTEDFGDFTTTHSTENFGAFESSSTIGTSKESSTGQTVTGSSTEQAEKSADFGDFSTAFGRTQTGTSPTSDEFGDFSTVQSTDKFAAFGDSTTQQTASSTTRPEDDFGDFSTGKSNFGSSGDAPTTSGTSTKDNFGDFSGGDGFSDFKTSTGDEEFGDFSSSSAGFGAFSTPGPSLPTATTPPVTKKDTTGVLMSSFPLVGLSAAEVVTVSNFLTLLMDSKTQDSNSQSVWQCLQRCVDLTIPLYKWDKSNLQDDYYSAIKVDPMLISRPSTMSVLTGHAKFEDPLGGTTAAEDLMESFGFEGELEESRKRDSVSPPPLMGRTPRKSEDRSTPTLLDLSLPETPGSTTGHDSFTLTEDLLGLDLNPQPQSQQLTSIQELLRNERLVVNKSNWVDSKLREFGEGEENTSSQPSTPQSAKRQNTVELQLQQLGLDANKVSSFTGGNRELSLAARTVLGRLPELTFMLDTEKVVQTNQYSI